MMADEFRVTLQQLPDLRNRDTLVQTGRALLRSVCRRALAPASTDAPSPSSADGVAVDATAEVVLLVMRVEERCTAREFDSAVAAFTVLDVLLRFTAAEANGVVAEAAPAPLKPEEEAELATAVVSVVQSEVSRRLVLVARHLLLDAGLPESLLNQVKLIVKRWRTGAKRGELGLSGSVLDALGEMGKKRPARPEGTAGEAEAPRQPPPHARDVDDDAVVADEERNAAANNPPPPPLVKRSVRGATALVKEVLSTLAQLSPSAAEPLWALMPETDSKSTFDVLGDPETVAALRNVLEQAKAALAASRAAVAAANQKKKPMAGGSRGLLGGEDEGPVAALTIGRFPSAPARLQCDVVKSEVPVKKEAPPAARPRPSPYSMPATRVPSGQVARRRWGIDLATWTDEKRLCDVSTCSLEPEVPSAGGVLWTSAVV